MNGATVPETSERVGEVVEASTDEFTVQCYTLYDAPPLGSLVRNGGDHRIYGVVYEVATRSMDPSRHPIARGRDESTEEGVYLSNPQLSRLLLTEFRSMIIGYQINDHLSHQRAPMPPRIHSFVYRCSGEEMRIFSSSLGFVHELLDQPISARDDVVAFFLQQASVSQPDPERFLIDAGKELAILLAGQLPRLNNLLRRLSP